MYRRRLPGFVPSGDLLFGEIVAERARQAPAGSNDLCGLIQRVARPLYHRSGVLPEQCLDPVENDIDGVDIG